MTKEIQDALSNWKDEVLTDDSATYDTLGLLNQVIPVTKLLASGALVSTNQVIDDTTDWTTLYANSLYEVTGLGGNGAPDGTLMGATSGYLLNVRQGDNPVSVQMAFSNTGKLAVRTLGNGDANTWFYMQDSSEFHTLVDNVNAGLANIFNKDDAAKFQADTLKSITDSVTSTVSTQMTDLSTKLTSDLTDKVTTLNSTLSTDITNNVNSLNTALSEDVTKQLTAASNSVDSKVSGLNDDVTSKVTALTKTVTDTETELNTNVTNLDKSVDDRINKMTDGITQSVLTKVQATSPLAGVTWRQLLPVSETDTTTTTTTGA